MRPKSPSLEAGRARLPPTRRVSRALNVRNKFLLEPKLHQERRMVVKREECVAYAADMIVVCLEIGGLVGSWVGGGRRSVDEGLESG